MICADKVHVQSLILVKYTKYDYINTTNYLRFLWNLRLVNSFEVDFGYIIEINLIGFK